MKNLKEEFENCTVVVKTSFNRRISINTANADLAQWANVKEFDFLFEEVKEDEKKDLSQLSLKELRAMFPDITSKSKSGFLEQLNEAHD